MILDHQQFDLAGKKVFERLLFNPPLKASQEMVNEACLIYAVNGQSGLYGGIQSDTIRTNESVLMKCGYFINHWQINEDDTPSEAIAIHFYPEVLKVVYDNQLPDYLKQPSDNNQLTFQKIDTNEVFKAYIDSLIVYFKNPALFTEDSIKLKLRELIALLYNTNSNGVRDILSALFTPEHIAFKAVIKSQLFNDLSLEDYADMVYMSVSSFKRKFKEVFDDTPARYIKHQRLEKAAQLLLTTSDSVSHICYACGFNDLSNFSKSFTKKYGVAPSDYKSSQLV